MGKFKSRKTLKVFRSLSVIVVINFGVFLFASAQDVEAKLVTFNEALGKSYQLSNKGKHLIVEGFREGAKVKIDKVNIYELDLATIKYSENDKTVSVKCYSDLDGCVKRTLVRERNKKSYRNRIVFAVPEKSTGKEIMTKLKLLLNEMSKKY